MPSVKARTNEPFENTLRRFKKAVEKSDLMKDLRDREFFEKPSLTRKRNKAAAKKRNQRRVEEEKLSLKRKY